MKSVGTFLAIIFCISVTISFVQSTTAQDQLEMPSWEVGWETDMGGVYELELSGDDGILDAIEFYVENQRMGELNLDITITWDESENIPIELEYQDSITIPGSDNQTFVIDIEDESGYSFDRSPSESMTLLLVAEEISFEQSVSSQEIEGELSVPSVFELEINSQSNNEILFSGSSIEYTINVENNGNDKDVIKSPEESIKSCPSLSIEGLDALGNVEVENSTNQDFTIRIVASQSHPDRTCEITLSIKSAGNGMISSTVFEVQVNSPSEEESKPNDINPDSNQTDQDIDVIETDSLDFLNGIEIIIILYLAIVIRMRKKC